jgi:hypothetical protein
MRIELLMPDRAKILDWIETQEDFFGRTIRWLVIGPSVCGCPRLHALLEQEVRYLFGRE